MALERDSAVNRSPARVDRLGGVGAARRWCMVALVRNRCDHGSTVTIAYRRRRWIAALALVIGVGVGGTAPAVAHGDPKFSGDVGPFAVQTFDEAISGTDLLYTVVVNDPSTGLPIRGATMEVSAASATREVGPLVGNELGGACQVLLPASGDEAWLPTVRVVVATTRSPSSTSSTRELGARQSGGAASSSLRARSSPAPQR